MLRLCPKHGAHRADVCRWCDEAALCHAGVSPTRPRRSAHQPGRTKGENVGIWAMEGFTEQCERLWRDGHSGSVIAQKLSADFAVTVTRNAVIGKVHRLGLAGRSTTSRKYEPSFSRQASRRRKQAARLTRKLSEQQIALRTIYQQADPLPPYKELEIPMAERKSILTLEDKDCRWPIGDPQHADFHFCGKQKVNGLPYCEFHARRAYVPPQTRPRSLNDAARLPRPFVFPGQHDLTKALKEFEEA